MIEKKHIPASVYITLLFICILLGFYISAAFLYDDLTLGNFGERIIRGCMDNHFLPWLIWNDKSLSCMGYGVIGWVLLSSYIMYHFRNYQPGMEHGVEDWGEAKEITKRRANVDTTKNRFLTRNLMIDTEGPGKMSNNNMLVIGTAGTYKTTSTVIPNLLHANVNYIVLDVKGELSYKCGHYLLSRGYTIRCLDLKNPERSSRYNPFAYIENEEDLIRLISTISDSCTPPDSMSSDPFWQEGRDLYLQSLFYYEWLTARRDGREGSINNVLKLIDDENTIDTSRTAPKGQQPFTVLQTKMDMLEKSMPGNPATRDYRKLKVGAAETVRSILIIVNAMLKLCQTEGLKRIFSKDDLHLREFATGVGGTIKNPNKEGKLALFMIVDDGDDSFNFVCSMVYTQALNILSRMADNDFKGGLPVPLEFWMDEFYRGARPMNVQGVMGIVRSRNISLIPILQSKAQLVDLMKEDKAKIIMENCPVTIFLGAGRTADDTHQWVSDLLGEMTIDTLSDTKRGLQVDSGHQKAGARLMTKQQVARIPLEDAIVFLQSERPVYDRKALPWENVTYGKVRLALLRRRAKKLNIPFDNPNYYSDAMGMNRNSPEGGFVNHVEVVVDEKGEHHTVEEKDIVVDAPPAGAKVITMTDEEIAKATIPDGKGAVRALLRGTKRGKVVEYEFTPDGRLVGEAELKISEKAEAEPKKPEIPSVDTPALLDFLATRADHFSEGAMEFILSAIDSGVDERAVRRMIAIDEVELLRICGEVG
ncbi:MAG: type IV secretory system conjugative DNA transfer family protein [Lachnospiraceae bacterium]|nr:type IV secretory system conjugative DNA transfer family protein [Lachnospiraceae bacterium]